MKQSIIGLMILIILCIAVPSFAQYSYRDYAEGSSTAFRVGVFFPSGDTVDSSEFMVGAEVEQPADKVFSGTSGVISLSLDYTKISTRTTDGDTDNVTLLPIFVNWKQYQNAGRNGRAWNYGFGLGVYWAEDDIPDMGLSNNTSFAWQLMLGYHFTPTLFADVRYMANGDPGDDGLTSLAIGYRY